MKKIFRLSALLLSAVASLAVLAGCGAAQTAAPAAADTAVQAESGEEEKTLSLPEASSADTAAEQEAETMPAETAPAEEAAPAMPREFRFTCDNYQSCGDFQYDEQGRLTQLSVSIFPDFSSATDIFITYDETGTPHAAFDPELVRQRTGTPEEVAIYELTTDENGYISHLSAGDGCAIYVDFGENHLPSYFSYAQEDAGYLLNYHITDTGVWTMDEPESVYGYRFESEITPMQDSALHEFQLIYG